jgi:predicted DCC family thiol-disulfide oxidoreductase YuxK
VVDGPILLFDGVCNLCNAVVQFVVARDRKHAFRFAALQSEAGHRLLREHGVEVPGGDPDSVVLIEGGRAYVESTAALRAARHLAFPWFLLWPWLVVPRFVRDPIYRWIARNRYRWFGKKDQCMIPTPELRARFL